MADISKITLGGTTYNIKDMVARQTMAGGMHYIGITGTALTDGSTNKALMTLGSNGAPTTTPLKAGNAYVAGDMVIYKKKEFVWDGAKWGEFGDNSAFKALAYADEAVGTITMAAKDHVHHVDIDHKHFIKPVNISASGTVKLSGTVTPQATGLHLSPDGQYIATNDDFQITKIRGVAGTTPVHRITNLGTVPTKVDKTVKSMKTAGTLPTFKAVSVPNVTKMFAASVNGETLTLTPGVIGTSIGINSLTGVGTLPTSEDVVVSQVTSVGTATTASPVNVATAAAGSTDFYAFDPINLNMGDINGSLAEGQLPELSTKIKLTLAANDATVNVAGKLENMETYDSIDNSGRFTTAAYKPQASGGGYDNNGTETVTITVKPKK